MKKNQTPKSVQKKSHKVLTLIIIFGLALVFLLGSYYKSEQAKHEKKIEAENIVMLEKISKLLNAPDEKPIVSTVNSKEDFANAPTFRSAEKGDKLFVWVSANQAVLYRPSTNQVLDITTVKATVETNN